MDKLVNTKYGLWRIKERAIPQVEAIAGMFGVSIERATEITIEQSKEA